MKLTWREYAQKTLNALAPLMLAMALTAIVLLVIGVSLSDAFSTLITGSLGSATKIADTMVVWVSLTLCASGLLLTFVAGQWNIGVEGQVTLGAIFATGMARWIWEWSGVPAYTLMLLSGMLGGALWALSAGVLKTYGKVHEIFGGLGLNFVATALSIYLIFGPWRRESGGTLGGTDLLLTPLWLPMLPGLRLSPYSVIIALAAVTTVYFALRGTVWGLQLKAVGKSLRGAYVLGIPTDTRLLSAYMLCGSLAGLAGALLVVGVHHQLIPSISSGYGFLGILIVLLSGFRALWVLPIAFFFAALSVGSVALQLNLQLDSSLSGVLQATFVLAFIFTQGLRATYWSKEKAA